MDNETFEKIINLIDTTIGVPFESPAMADALGMDYEMGAVIRWEHALTILDPNAESDLVQYRPYIFEHMEEIHKSHLLIEGLMK